MVGSRQIASDTLRQTAFACREHLWAAFAFSALVNVLYLAPSLFMLQIYDRVLMTGGLLTLAFLSLALLGALATLAWLDAMRGRILARAGLRLDKQIAATVMRASLMQDPRAPRAGSREALRDLDTLRQTLVGAPALSVFDAPWAVFFVAVCFVMHWAIGAFALFGCFALVAMAIFNERAQQRSIKQIVEQAPIVYAAQDADAAGAEAARALGMREALVQRSEARRAPLLEAQATSAFIQSGYGAGTKLLRLILQSAVLALGAVLAVQQQITPGAMIAASIISARAFAPLEQIVGSWRALIQGVSSWRNLEAVLAAAPPPRERMPLPAPAGRLAVDRVVMATPDGKRPALQGVSFEIAPGDIVGVVGPSGAGKTTLARVIAGAVPAQSGIVRLDGANIADWNSELLARHVGYLPQDVSLFDGTIADNISRFASSTGTPSEALSADIVAAARQAGAHDMILRLPEGYDTKLGSRGAGLSAGQAQRIALARALFRDPVLIILDEPNAHLDAEGEIALVGALHNAKQRGAVSLVIAHRLGVLGAADKILVLREGRVVEYGPRADIMEKMRAGANAGPGV
jgi:PrtD family type I secretion system ABC transporter